MGINNTKKEAQKNADKDLAKKLALEKGLILDLLVFFSQLALDYQVIYSSTGKILTLNESYEDELKALLKRNYRAISNNFDDNLQEMIEAEINLKDFEVIPKKKNDLKNKIGMAIGAYILLRGDEIAPKIVETIQNEINKKTQQYIIDQASSGIAVSQAEVANAVAEKINNFGINHAPTVATTEVQSVAEKSKNIESLAINDMAMSYGEQTLKTWITAGDEKVRTSHEVLDGKTIPANDLFITGAGSSMLYAGDMSNGASLGDVINCRCSTIYKLNDKIVKIYKNTIFRRKKV